MYMHLYIDIVYSSCNFNIIYCRNKIKTVTSFTDMIHCDRVTTALKTMLNYKIKIYTHTPHIKNYGDAPNN